LQVVVRFWSRSRALSVVFPAYGLWRRVWPDGVGVHEFQDDYWHLLSPEVAAARVVIDPRRNGPPGGYAPMNNLHVHNLGDRHLRPIGGLSRPGGGRRVRITAGDTVSRSVAGQHTLWMLANLLARQFGVVAEVEVAVPRVPLHPQVALFGGREHLPDTLAEVVRLVAGDAVRVAAGVEPADVEVIVGCDEAGRLPCTHRVAVLGAGWRVFAGRPGAVPDADLDDTNTLGPYFAACVAAGEVFKRLCGLQPGKGSFIGH